MVKFDEEIHQATESWWRDRLAKKPEETKQRKEA